MTNEGTDGGVVDGLSTIAEGATLVFGGRLVKLALFFGSQLVMARLLGRVSYGGVVIATTVVQVGTILGTLGVDTGVVRKLPEYEDDPEGCRGIVRAGVRVVSAASFALGLGVFLSAPAIAKAVFGDATLVPLLRLAAIGIPCSVFMELGISIARGLRDAGAHVLARQLLRPLSEFAFVAALVAAGYGAFGAMAGVVAALAVGAGSALWLAYRTIPFGLRGPVAPASRELVAFSLPLVFAASTSFLVGNTDTFVVGAFLSSGDVGLYNAAFQLQQLGLVFFYPVTFLLPPVLTRLQRTGSPTDVGRTYRTATKWMTLATVPVFLLLLGFPGVVIGSSFGPGYVDAAPLLRILAVPVFVTVLLGANGAALVALGHNRINMYVNVAVAGLNLAMNLALVPVVGLVGAAFASATAFVTRDVVYSVALYRWHGVHSLTWPNVKPLVAVGGLAVPVYAVFTGVAEPTPVSVAALGLASGIVYLVLLVRLDAIEPADAELLGEIEASTGVDLRVLGDAIRWVTER